jgi:histidyl-tRNA synthetase
MKLQRAKGMRDFSFEESLFRQRILDVLTKTFQLYGYSPMDTPLIESYDVLASKYSGGAEILKEMFTLQDQGKRKLGLRYDLTVPLARYMAMNPQMKLPLKRYQIGRVYRDGPLKAGRYREFSQCDVDVVGVVGMEADAEILTIAKAVFKRLKLDVVIKVNNRKVLDKIMEKCSIPTKKRESVMLTVDKLDKFGMDAVKDELKNKSLSLKEIQLLFSLLLVKGTNTQKLRFLMKELGECDGLTEMEKLLSLVKDVEFDVSLARGLSYYTGTVFEVFMTDECLTCSLAAGGRYDNMIGDFIGRGYYPAVGLSFGQDTIAEALKTKQKMVQQSVSQVYVIPITTFSVAWTMTEELRKGGLNCEIDLMGRSISKNLDYADKRGIPYVLFIGEQEVKKKKVKLRDMKGGKEEFLSLKDVAKKFTSS